MELVYKNLVIDITAVDSHDFEADSGFGNFTIAFSDFEKLYNTNSDLRQDILDGNNIEVGWFDYLDGFLVDNNHWFATLLEDVSIEDSPEQYLNEFLDNSGDQLYLDFYNADVMIVLMANILSLEDEFRISYEGNPFWICHDLMHAIKDCVSNYIYVDADIEESRLEDGFELLNDNLCAPHYVTHEMVVQMHKSFRDRFKRELDVPTITEYLGMDDYYYE